MRLAPTLILSFATMVSPIGCGRPTPERPEAPAPAADATPAEVPVTHDTTPSPPTTPERAAWKVLHGELTLPQGLTLRLALRRTADGVRLDIPEQNLRDFPIADLADGPPLTFSLLPPGAPEAARARFSVAPQADGTFKGTLTQGGLALPIVLEPSVDEALPARERPQTPRPPFPYPTHDFTIPVEGGELACTLALPAGPGPHPGLIMRTGSGAQDRDETLFDHKPFLVLADALARAGVATLRCDDRGAGASAAARPEDDLATFLADARAMLAALAARPELDPTRLGVLGHSEGGITAATLLSRDTPPTPSPRGEVRPAFAVLLAGPALSGREVLAQQNADLVRGQGATEAEAKAMFEAVSTLFGADDTSRAAAAEALADLTISMASPGASPPRDTLVAQFVSNASNPWMRSFVKAEPRLDLVKARGPVLALFGERDTQVPRRHAEVLREDLAAHPEAPVEVALVPELNHLFQRAQTGALGEYATLTETLAPEVLTRVTEWVRKTTGLLKPGPME